MDRYKAALAALENALEQIDLVEDHVAAAFISQAIEVVRARVDA